MVSPETGADPLPPASEQPRRPPYETRKMAAVTKAAEAGGERYLQVEAWAAAERFSFEIVQRDGYTGFGAANAAIRQGAQARLSCRPAAPVRLGGEA